MYYMCRIYNYITHICLSMQYMCRFYTCIICVKDAYYRCINYMCNRLKTPYMHYICITHANTHVAHFVVYSNYNFYDAFNMNIDL